MTTKPVKPLHHGVIDYIFSGLQISMPFYLGLNKNLQKPYLALGTGFLAVNALTDTPVGIRKEIPFETHRKVDLGFLAGLGLLTAAPFIRKEKSARALHLLFLGAAVAHYLLTGYNGRDKVVRN